MKFFAPFKEKPWIYTYYFICCYTPQSRVRVRSEKPVFKVDNFKKNGRKKLLTVCGEQGTSNRDSHNPLPDNH